MQYSRSVMPDRPAGKCQTAWKTLTAAWPGGSLHAVSFLKRVTTARPSRIPTLPHTGVRTHAVNEVQNQPGAVEEHRDLSSRSRGRRAYYDSGYVQPV